MQEVKFKVGDYITHIDGYCGFEDAIITGIDGDYYRLKIPNGIATVKISSQVNYEIKTSKRALDIKG